MTPHRSNRRGTYLLDRTFPGIGRVRVASGTLDLTTYRACDAMLTALWQTGRPDLLLEIRDGRIKPMVALGWYRLGKLDRLPTGEALRPFREAWEAWVKGLDRPSPSHLRDLKVTLTALQPGDRPMADAVELLTALKVRKAGKERTIQKAKANLMAFLRDTVGTDHPLYRAVRGVQVPKVVVEREGRPLLPEEVRAIIRRMPEGGADFWTLCATGMLTKEYRGVWRLLPDRLEIDGTKRKGRKRIVPRWTTVTRPTIGARKLARLVRLASGGTVLLKDTRDTFSRWLREAGVTSLNRRFYMGHGASSMTEHYEWGELPGQLTEDAAKLERYAGLPVFGLVKSGA